MRVEYFLIIIIFIILYLTTPPKWGKSRDMGEEDGGLYSSEAPANNWKNLLVPFGCVRWMVVVVVVVLLVHPLRPHPTRCERRLRRRRCSRKCIAPSPFWCTQHSSVLPARKYIKVFRYRCRQSSKSTVAHNNKNFSSQ